MVKNWPLLAVMNHKFQWPVAKKEKEEVQFQVVVVKKEKYELSNENWELHKYKEAGRALSAGEYMIISS